MLFSSPVGVSNITSVWDDKKSTICFYHSSCKWLHFIMVTITIVLRFPVEFISKQTKWMFAISVTEQCLKHCFPHKSCKAIFWGNSCAACFIYLSWNEWSNPKPFKLQLHPLHACESMLIKQKLPEHYQRLGIKIISSLYLNSRWWSKRSTLTE